MIRYSSYLAVLFLCQVRVNSPIRYRSLCLSSLMTISLFISLLSIYMRSAQPKIHPTYSTNFRHRQLEPRLYKSARQASLACRSRWDGGGGGGDDVMDGGEMVAAGLGLAGSGGDERRIVCERKAVLASGHCTDGLASLFGFVCGLHSVLQCWNEVTVFAAFQRLSCGTDVSYTKTCLRGRVVQVERYPKVQTVSHLLSVC